MKLFDFLNICIYSFSDEASKVNEEIKVDDVIATTATTKIELNDLNVHVKNEASLENTVKEDQNISQNENNAAVVESNNQQAETNEAISTEASQSHDHHEHTHDHHDHTHDHHDHTHDHQNHNNDADHHKEATPRENSNINDDESTTSTSVLNRDDEVTKPTEILSNILRTATVPSPIATNEADNESNKSDDKSLTSTTLDSTSTENETKNFHPQSHHHHHHASLEVETLKHIKNPAQQRLYPSKYCADIAPLRDLFSHHIEPIYSPLIALLPEHFQLVLLDETSFGGMRTASCLLVALLLASLCLIWLLMLKRKEQAQLSVHRHLNETVLMLNNRIKNLSFDKQTFEAEYGEMAAKVSAHEAILGEKDAKLSELAERHAQLKKTAEASAKEADKLKSGEAKSARELNQCKLELSDLNERFAQQNNEYNATLSSLTQEYNARLSEVTAQMAERESQLTESRQELAEKTSALELCRVNETQLNGLIEQHEKKILILQNSLLRDQKHSSSNNSLDLNVAGDEYVKINNEDLNAGMSVCVHKI